METRIHVRIATLISYRQISSVGVCGWSCDSDYRGLKKRIMLIKSAQQSGNDQHLTGTVSSDSEHESLPSGSGASKWADVFTRRGNAGGRRAADTQDERQKQEPEAAMEQIELDDVKTRGDDVPNVGVDLLSQCVNSIFFPKKTDSTTDDNDTPATKQHTGVVILDFIPYSPRSGRPSAARRGSQLLDKLRRRSSRCDYFFCPPSVLA
jgi:hypothetical protein